MDNFFKELVLLIVKSVIAYAIAATYALIRMAITGDTGRLSTTESLIVLVVSIILSCCIVKIASTKTNKRR